MTWTTQPPAFGDHATPQPLRGRMVVDLSQFIAGSAAGQLLADFGASVVKVEPPGGDPARGLGQTEHGSVYYRHYNTGKRTRVLDLAAEAGRTALEELLAGGDAVITNFGPRTLAKYGLDWSALHARHPHLVLVQISAHGEGDDRTAFDSVIQAASGFARLNAAADDSPRISAGYPTDVFSGLYGGLSAAMALLDPLRTDGVLVDVSMIEVAMAALCGPAMLTAAEIGKVDPGQGNRDAATAPSSTFRCRDGWVYLYAGLDKHWHRWCTLVGRPDLAAPLSARLAAPATYETAISEWTSRHTVAEVCREAFALGVPASPVNDAVTALARARDTRTDAVVAGDTGRGAIPRFPVAFSGARVPRSSAPSFPAPDQQPDQESP